MVVWSTVEKALGVTKDRGPARDTEKGRYSGSSLHQILLLTEPAEVPLTWEFGEYNLKDQSSEIMSRKGMGMQALPEQTEI